MSIQNDRWIRDQAIRNQMIEDFGEEQAAAGAISRDLPLHGFDLRITGKLKMLTQAKSPLINLAGFDEAPFVAVQAGSAIGPRNSFAWAHSVHYFRIPRDVLTICVGKSTHARYGIATEPNAIEPEQERFETKKISQTTALPDRVYANEKLCQVLFFRSDEPSQVRCDGRKGKHLKYQRDCASEA